MLTMMLLPFIAMARPDGVPNGATKYGNNYYKVISFKGTMPECKREARKLKGSLVVIDSKAENDFVKGLLGSKQTWMSMFLEERRTAKKVEKSWKQFTSSGMSKATYFNWNENRGTGKYALTDGTGLWKCANGLKTKLNYFVCEWNE